VSNYIGQGRNQVETARFRQDAFPVEETADVLHVSAETVKGDWRLAKLSLLRELKADAGPSRRAHRT
jgi:hypothetical protein